MTDHSTIVLCGLSAEVKSHLWMLISWYYFWLAVIGVFEDKRPGCMLRQSMWRSVIVEILVFIFYIVVFCFVLSCIDVNWLFLFFWALFPTPTDCVGNLFSWVILTVLDLAEATVLFHFLGGCYSCVGFVLAWT